MNFEKRSSSVEQGREEEISIEKRSRMWETLRIATLAGLAVFGGYKAQERSGEMTQQKPVEATQGISDQQQEVEEKFKEDFGREMTEDERQLLEAWKNQFGEMSSQERDSIMISDFHDKGLRVEDGKIIQETTVKTKDGKTYDTSAEIDARLSSLVDPETGNLKVGKLASEGETAWNRAFVSRLEQDGSGLKVSYQATQEGLKMTIQELGPGGKVVSERVSVTQEVNK